MTESARAEAFASQADKSRALAAQHLQQVIAAVTTFRQLRDSVNRLLADMKIEFRWVDTRLDLMGPLGEWVEGPDLRGMRGHQGPAIELRNNEGAIECRVQDSQTGWTALVNVAAQVTAAEAAAALAGERLEDAEIAAGQAANAAGAAEDARDLAAAFASAPENVEVAPGQFSSRHHAEKARQYAEAAEQFDPSDYYNKGEVDDALEGKVDNDDLTSKADLVDGKLKINQRGAVPIARLARTANSQLGAADLGKFFDITSGTFTQTFAAAATLGDGWWAYIRNSGAGTITLDPNGSETIDGSTTLTLLPGETVLIQCSGTALFVAIHERRPGSFGAVGTYVVATSTAFANSTTYNAGETFAGSTLSRQDPPGGNGPFGGAVPTNVIFNTLGTLGLSGTWMLMSAVRRGSETGNYPLALFCRVA